MAEKQNIIKPELKWWEKPIDFSVIGDLFKAQPIDEQMREAKEKDYGKVDKDWTFYESMVTGEPLKQKAYLNQMAGLMEQGPSRGGTKSGQFVMNQMDIAHRKEQEDAAEEKRIKDENDAKKAEEERLAKEEAEYRDTFKGRLQTLFEDSGRRDAILSGISETMLETRYGKDVYGSRMADVSKNVRDKLREEEAMAMVKDQAILDMMKTQAETASINNPMQFLSNTQKNARDYATAQGAIANPPFAQGSKEWAAAYAQGLENMAMENLVMAPVEGIAAINELLARNTGMFDDATIKVFKDVIANLTGRITGDGGAINTNYNTIIGKRDGVDSN